MRHSGSRDNINDCFMRHKCIIREPGSLSVSTWHRQMKLSLNLQEIEEKGPEQDFLISFFANFKSIPPQEPRKHSADDWIASFQFLDSWKVILPSGRNLAVVMEHLSLPKQLTNLILGGFPLCPPCTLVYVIAKSCSSEFQLFMHV